MSSPNQPDPALQPNTPNDLQLQLRHAEERYRLLAETSRDLITLHRLDGVCTYASPASTAMLGYKPEEITGRPLQQLFHPKDSALFRQFLDRHLNNQTETSFSHRLRRSDGGYLWCETTARSTRSNDGDLKSSIIAVTRDISKRRGAEKELKSMHLLLSSVFETVPVGLCITNPAGRILQCNRSFATALGHMGSALVGSLIEDFIPSEYLLPGARDFTCLRNSGEIFPAHISVTDLSHGDDGNTLLTLSDYTERNAIEARLREAQRLESLGTLAGGIAHDFNNLLAIILGYASLLRQVAPEAPQVGEYGDIIMDAGRRGADVVRQLMMYANQQDPLLSEEDIHTILANAIVRHTAEWPERIRLDCNFNSTRPLVSIDPEQIGRAIEHLLRNAREAIFQEGSVTLSTFDRPASQPGEPDWLEINITDTGCGMDDDTRSRMFEPFFVRNKGSEVRGLGLPMVYGIIRAHRGRIEVESSVGKGTTVRLLIPRPATGNSLTTTSEGNNTQVAEKTGHCILLVEDEADIGRLWVDLLSREGWTIHWAKTGPEALELFQREGSRIELLFSDIGLPGGMDGWDLCGRIRAQRPTLPILLASGYFKRGMSRPSAGLSEPVVYIGKPCQPAEVLSRLRELLNSP